MTQWDNYIEAGISIIPTKPDKRPAIAWKEFQSRIATEAEYSSWSLPIAAVCGEVSQGLLCIDFDDGGSAFKEWGEIVNDVNPDILPKIVCQQTPSGGYHVLFRTDIPTANLKLAQKLVDGKVQVLIETRGEGGYFLIAPSNGYVLKRGTPERLPHLTDQEANTLLNCAKSMDQTPKEKDVPQEVHTPLQRNGLSPFDDYDGRENPIAMLESYGWKVIAKRKDGILFCRPGKNDGISASWNHVPDRFYAFSTSTQFEAGHVYKASAVFTMLEHNGDFVQAAKDLSAKGYGEKLERSVNTPDVNLDTVATTTLLRASDFRDRIYEYYKGERDKGFRTGIVGLDNILRLDHGYLNIVVGIPSHGKSEFVDHISVLLAKLHGWKFTVFSPENYPLEIHYDKLAQKFHQAYLWNKPPEFIEEAIEWIDEHYRFIDATEDEISLDAILAATLEEKTDCLIIDPWNELENTKPHGMNDSEFIGNCLRKLRKFARKNGVCIILVAHPTKMYKSRDTGETPVPSLYDVSGSANFYNKADNGIVVYRNFTADITTIHVKKVKYRNYGHIGSCDFKFIKEGGLYEEVSGF